MLKRLATQIAADQTSAKTNPWWLWLQATLVLIRLTKGLTSTSCVKAIVLVIKINFVDFAYSGNLKI